MKTIVVKKKKMKKNKQKKPTHAHAKLYVPKYVHFILMTMRSKWQGAACMECIYSLTEDKARQI